MKTFNEQDIQEIITIKLETTRAICDAVAGSTFVDLSADARIEFADIIELFAVLMLEHAGEFPEEWSSSKLSEVYHYKLPTLLHKNERKNIREILMTYVSFVGEALELPNYREIKEELAS